MARQTPRDARSRPQPFFLALRGEPSSRARMENEFKAFSTVESPDFEFSKPGSRSSASGLSVPRRNSSIASRFSSSQRRTPGSARTQRACRLILLLRPPVRGLSCTGRLVIEDEGVAVVGDSDGLESGDIERIADVGQAEQLRPPPDHRARDRRQDHHHRGPIPLTAPADPAERREESADCREVLTPPRGMLRIHGTPLDIRPPSAVRLSIPA